MTTRSCTFINPHNTVCCTECGSDLSLCQCVAWDQAAHDRLTSPDGLVFVMIRDELVASREAFPETTHKLAALMEEVGELAQAMMHHDRKLGISTQEVLREAVQVATVALRIAVEGDDNFLYEFPIVEDELPRGPMGRTYD